MRIVKAGPVAATLEQVEALRFRVEAAGIDAVREAMGAWGFVAEVDPGEIPEPYMISYTSDTFGEQGAYLFAPEGADYTFFLHGYRVGTPLLCDEAELEVPEPGPLPQSLIDRYIPPSAHANPTMVVPPPKHPLYVCAKCGSRKPQFSQLRGQGGGLDAYMDWDTEVFTVVSCQYCSYSELYRETILTMKARILPRGLSPNQRQKFGGFRFHQVSITPRFYV